MFILGLDRLARHGKSTTARFFAEEGVPVHDADAVVHRLYEGEAVAAIEAAFPDTTRRPARSTAPSLPRGCSAMPPRCKRLEAIVHPLVQAAERQLLAEAAGARRKGRRARHSAAVRDRRRPAGRRRRGGVGARRRCSARACWNARA